MAMIPKTTRPKITGLRISTGLEMDVSPRRAEEIMTCVKCEQLTRSALRASKAYHRLQEELERKYILQGQQPLLVEQDVQEAERDRAVAIRELAAHKDTHDSKLPRAELRLCKRQSA
jgi:hypothetical protein